jgi:hypothetical protein
LEFSELFLLDQTTARELAAEAIEKRNPAAWLNKAVTGKLKELAP